MTALAHNDFILEAIKHWKHISPVIHEPQNADDYANVMTPMSRPRSKIFL
jgi:HTH-type transcriptional regulator / antitoxin HigA